MIPDATFDPVPERSRKLRLRFSLLALFVFVTLVCLLLAWWVQPNRVVATALFRVSRVSPTIVGDESTQAGDEREWETIKNTQVALLKSYFVLNAAMRKPGIAALPTLQHQEDTTDWLERHIEVQYPEDGEILEISLRGTEAQSSDLVQIVDAVAKAYNDEVIYKERSQQLSTRDQLARVVEGLKHEIADKSETYFAIARESGRIVDESGETMRQVNMNRLERIETELMRLENEQLQLETGGEPGNAKFYEKRIAQLRERQAELEKKLASMGAASVEMNALKEELEQLQRIANELSIKVEVTDIEAQAPRRIEQVQPAVSSPAD